MVSKVEHRKRTGSGLAAMSPEAGERPVPACQEMAVAGSSTWSSRDLLFPGAPVAIRSSEGANGGTIAHASNPIRSVDLFLA